MSESEENASEVEEKEMTHDEKIRLISRRYNSKPTTALAIYAALAMGSEIGMDRFPERKPEGSERTKERIRKRKKERRKGKRK
jgi:hypothetical protein